MMKKSLNITQKIYQVLFQMGSVSVKYWTPPIAPRYSLRSTSLETIREDEVVMGVFTGLQPYI